MDLGPHSSPCSHGISLSTCTTGEKGPSPLKPWGSLCFFLLFSEARPPPCSLWDQAAPRAPRMPSAGRPLELCTRRNCWVPGLCILPPTGVGSAPQVRITGPEEDGVRVVCTASGWFPKPQVQWRDVSGEKFLAFSEAHTQDAEGLFSVEAALVVRDSSVGNVTCSILNPVLGQEEAMAIFIPGQRCSRLPARLEEGAGCSWVFRAGLSWVGALTGCLAGLQSPSSPRPLPGRWLSQ